MLFRQTIAALKNKVLQFKEENLKLRGGKPSTRKPQAVPSLDANGEEFVPYPKQVKELNAELEAEQKENAELKARVSAPPSAPVPSASITKPSTTPAPMITPSTSKAPAAMAPKADPLADCKFISKAKFESLSHEKRNEFMANGGHLVDMKDHESPKYAAERTIQHVNDTPENVAEVLLKGWGLSTADTTELVLAKFNGKHDSKFKQHTEASLKEAIAKAERSPRPTGYLLQGAHAVDQPKRFATLNTFKRPDEVSEPDRLAAETALMNLYAEFEKIEDGMVRQVWWERNRQMVYSHAVNETRRSSGWLGVFISKLPHTNAHVF